MNMMSSPPPTPLTGSLTPGGYMHHCRKRAGKTVAECAKAIALRREDRVRARHDLRQLEANQPGDYSRLVAKLRDHAAFPFDLGTFAALAAETSDETMGEGLDL